MKSSAENLGVPDLQLGELQIWIKGRQFPNAADYWDGNWLQITAYCSARGANVWASGPFLRVPDLVRWIEGCERLHEALPGEAYLGCMEPDLSVTLRADKLGNIIMSVDITPDYLTQKHSFEFTIDQSYLPAFISACGDMLSKYPLIGKPDNEQ